MPTRLISNPLSLFPPIANTILYTQLALSKYWPIKWRRICQNPKSIASDQWAMHALLCQASSELFGGFLLVKSSNVPALQKGTDLFCIICLQTRKENEMSCCKPSQITCPLPSVCGYHVGYWKEDGSNYVLCIGTRHNSLHILRPVRTIKITFHFQKIKLICVWIPLPGY